MRIVLLICLVSFGAGLEHGSEQGRDTLSVLFWNLENFFDWKADAPDGNSSDKEFSSSGLRHWNRNRFQTKCNAIAKTLFWVEETEGSLPDIVAAAEVENSFVLRKLLSSTALRKTDYRYVHYDSPDPRGIDVALLYRQSRLELLGSEPVEVGTATQEKFRTRDILLATFRAISSDDTLAVLVNHHPSKYGSDSQWKRVAALERLRSVVDSVRTTVTERIIATGDFNDTPDNEAFDILTSGRDGLENLAVPLFRKGLGTIRYSGKWDLIDQFLVSHQLLPDIPGREMKILRVPFLTVKDTAHSGEKPLRTYSGPRYIGGVSDHCPVFLQLCSERVRKEE
ncbi:MAG: hypothetical protein MJY84_09265 [Bacteroidales bacterium]|nr:hypothetical protein [Bacteroidales bacterium]